MIKFFLILHFFASPELLIHWSDPIKQNLELRLRGEDKYADSCLDSGLEVQYRFEAKLCKKPKSWIEKCSDEMIETHFLNFDPISQSYNVVLDRHRDDKDPETKVIPDRASALKQLRTLKDLTLDVFNKFNPSADKENMYLSARVFSRCQGEYSKTWADISYYLSFGFIRLDGFNTGWQDYIFDNESNK